MRVFLIWCVCSFLSYGKASGQIEPANGLVAFYPFNGNADDASGNGHHGQVLNGLSLTTDRFGNANAAYAFDGVDDYIRITDNGAFSTPQFSIVLWFQSASDQLQNLVAKREFTTPGAGGAQYQFFINYPPFPGIGSNVVGNNSTCTSLSTTSYLNTGDWICRSKWHCAVITFDGARHKVYIDGVLRKNEATPFSALLSCNSELRFGNWWQGDLIPYNGKMDDIRWYNRALNEAEATALFGNFSATDNPSDFTYNQNMCNPALVWFYPTDPAGRTGRVLRRWFDYGDGKQSEAFASSFGNLYTNYGDYAVKMTVEYEGGCVDSVVKKIPVRVEAGQILSADTTVCKGDLVALRPAASYVNYCWQATGYPDITGYTPFVRADGPVTYKLTAQLEGQNLVVNGDFEAGNLGFASDYTYNAISGVAPGTYTLAKNATAWNPAFSLCKKLRGDTSILLLVNGSTGGPSIAWAQTVTVQPHTNYGFSVFFHKISNELAGSIRLRINGAPVNEWALQNDVTCVWGKPIATWNSGNLTSASLAIEIMSMSADGNDFGLDDIFFGPITTRTDSVRIGVAEKPTLSVLNDTAICAGGSVVLQTQTAGAVQYHWSPATGLSDATSANPVAKPTVTTKYVVEAIAAGGCTAKDSVVVTVKTPQQCNSTASVAGFSAPDTVCVNAPVAITNTSTGASNYYWNFCVANSTTNPAGTNLGNFGFSLAVFVDYAKEGDNWYAFVTNNMPGRLVRLDFGNSLLNTPTAHDFGNLGGVIPDYCEGIQVVKNEGRWYAIIVGDQPVGRIVKVDFGPSLNNDNPIATNWGNIGNLAFPTDLHLFQNGTDWYGLTINAQTNTITRFSFSASFTNVPTGVNLGNIGGLNYPTGIYAISKNGLWHAFVTNQGGPDGNSLTASLTRLDFGNSLLNAPSGTNLGNPGNALRGSRDISIYQSCNEIFGYVVNNSAASDIVRLNFNNSLTAVPAAVSLGNTGNLSFPHCISKLFRVDNDLYSFVANASNNTITRLRFEGCNSASINYSTEQNPPPIRYGRSGTYNINLTIDEGLPTQSAFCRQVVVLDPPAISTKADTTLCPGDAVQLTTTATGAVKYSWSPAAGLSDSALASPVATPAVTTQYVLTATNAAGCISKDTVVITVRTQQQCKPVIPLFTANDTVCVNTPVVLTNASTGASNYYWNFCVADLNTAPAGQNLGNPGNTLSQPVFMDYAFDKGNYYGFVINHYPGALIRLDFGNSLLNMPAAVNLGNFSGIIPPGYGAEGIQVVQSEGRWYAIIVGGYQPSGSTPRVLTIAFGPNLNNPIPAAINWNNIGDLSQPVDLHVFKEGDKWYGFTLNAENNTITRFDFGSNFTSIPTAVNLGNIGSLSYPTGIYAIDDNGFWRVFILNSGTGNGSSSSLTRLDFGSSLLNTPVGVNLGNPGIALKLPRDLTITRQCGQIVGFAVNAKPLNDLVKLDFRNNLSATPVITSLGNTGNSAFPHSISKLFRVKDDVYGFITNVDNNSLTRLRFAGCSSVDQVSSTQDTPAPVTYNKPGVYNINLTVDDGLPTQAAYCRQVVVIDGTHTPLQVKSICAGDSVLLSSLATTGNVWSDGSTTPALYAKAAGVYWVKSTAVGGCINTDSFRVDMRPLPVVNLGGDKTFCAGDSLTLDAGNAGANFLWQNGQTVQRITVHQQGLHHVAVTKDGCTTKDSVSLSLLPLPTVSISGNTTICREGSTVITATGAVGYSWSPAMALSNPAAGTTTAGPLVSTTYVVTATGTNGCLVKDSVTITVDPKPVFSAFATKPIVCKGDTVSLVATGGDRYQWWPAMQVTMPGGSTTIATPPSDTRFKVLIEEDGCGISDSLFIMVKVTDKPLVQTTKSNDITCFLGQATLTTGGGNRYRWLPATGLSDAASATPLVRINESTMYRVQVTTAEGCTVEDSITVNVLKGEGGFPVPDAFTPNGDGKNDCFGVRYWGDVQDFSLRLYNRWGELVFQAKQPSQCWDGRYKGQLQPGDVYVYLIKAKTRCGEVVRKGTFVLIR